VSRTTESATYHVRPAHRAALRALTDRTKVPQSEWIRIALDMMLAKYGDAEFGVVLAGAPDTKGKEE
jgi:hypothetical protein